MNYLLCCIGVLIGSYFLNILYISIFYHRAIAHGSVTMHPWLRKIVLSTGNWITGIDPKGWACMHRLHHKYSDTKKDPHSPLKAGIWRVMPLQLRSYKRALAGLILGDRQYVSLVTDLNFPVNWLNRKHLWALPYLLHAFVATGLGIYFNAWLLAACYWIGIMSHPLQGWLVNAISHRFGYRNFETSDNSKNNVIVAWLVFGEGYQNNHHYNPHSPSFSRTWWEIDFGYVLALALASIGAVKLQPLNAGERRRVR